jgi:S1-C subfamily serine protease
MQEDVVIPATEDFFSLPGFQTQIQEGVMPLLAKDGDSFVIVGTGFIISHFGLMMTATHVIEYAESFKIRTLNDAGEYYDHTEMFAFFISRQGERLIGDLIPIQKVWYCDEHDIGLCFLQETHFEGKRVYFPQFILSPGIPKEGERIIAFGYPYNKVEANSDLIKYFHKNAYARGHIIKVHEKQHDFGKFNFPCFRTEARFDHGMSGGPIFNENGKVCGVVCSGLAPSEEGQEYFSIGSLMGIALTIELDLAFNGDTNTEDLTLYDLVERGFVATDETIKHVGIKIRESKEGQPVDEKDFSWFS